jgi:mannose-6-phosphate isomerase-like protein (cupin superfamily)
MNEPTNDDRYQVFQAQPTPIASGKSAEWLARTDLLTLNMQVIAEGGENNLHAHTASEEIWLVIEGEVTFHGEGDRVLAKVGRNGGILIPHGAPYWFESTGSGPATILRFGAPVPGVEGRRIDYTPQPETIRKLRAEMAERDDEAIHIPAS